MDFIVAVDSRADIKNRPYETVVVPTGGKFLLNALGIVTSIPDQRT